MRALITGITGFAGSYLAEYLVENHPKIEVIGLKRWNSPLKDILSIMPKIKLLNFELGDPFSIENAIQETEPDLIFHLAAQSYVPMSFLAPHETLRANVLGTVSLLEAVRKLDNPPRVFVCTSSEVYGEVPESDLPITEDTKFHPQSPYGVSKVAEDLTAAQYYESYGVHVVRARSFTHTGPRSKPVFVAPAIARQIALAERGEGKEIRIGNINSIRTFLDVRDMVRAYWMMINQCPPGEFYNVAGDATMTIGELVERFRKLSQVEVSVKRDPSLERPSDVTRQVPSSEKFRAATGWEPEIPFELTMRQILDYWRKEL